MFSCPNAPVFFNGSTPGNGNAPCPPLAHFSAYAIHRTRLPEVVVFTSLFLLARLKERFPAARGSSGHRLFIFAFMIASKVICDDTYSNKSRFIAGQNLYTLKEVNQMEREMCSYLEWLLHVEAPGLEAFTQRVKKEYSPDCGPNPPQWVSSPAPVVAAAAPTPITPLDPIISLFHLLASNTITLEPVVPSDV
jgi:Cyclin, N-terminal domain